MKLKLFALLFFSSKAFSQGIFVYKNHNIHADSEAHAFVYTSISDQGVVTWVTIGGERIRFEKNKFHKSIEVRKFLPEQLVSDIEIASFRKEVSDMQDFHDRFNAARPLLMNSLNSMKLVIKKLDDGQLLYEKQWISQKEYSSIQDKLLSEKKALSDKKIRLESERMALEKRLKEEADETLKKSTEAARQKRELMKEQRISKIEKEIILVRDQIRNISDRQAISINKLNNLITEE